ncbi:gamma-glutamyltransferase [Anabaena azotica]|uniref:gamma-glutamyltransferase n=1 Tax=Anabaena azotica TaxID=197653 RepID=UPI0039A55211
MSQVIIASGSQISADAGAAVANQGGNAVDAAIAATIVSMSTDLGVMAAGGSGFITIWPANAHPIVIDGYAEMPGRGLENERFGKGIREVFFDYGGKISTVLGYGTIATPGMFAALGKAWEQYGNLSWADVVAPAQKWAERGFPLSGGAAEYLLHAHTAIFSWHPQSYKTLHHVDGTPVQHGEIIHVPGLAESLKLIAQEGVQAFYTGELGERIVKEIQENQGLLTAADLAAYQAIERSPICINFDDWQIATNPPPAVGGACLAAMLLLLDGYCLREWNLATVKQMVEVQHAVLNYRNYHLDLAGDRTGSTAKLLELASVGKPQTLLTSPSTIHISAVDSNGLACAITASAGYGSGVMVAGTGFWFNNSLGEIELHPQGCQHLKPGVRLTSNMSPTIAHCADGSVLAIGSPGASRITTALAQVLLNFVHLGMSLEDAIAHPRLHVETREGAPTIVIEAGIPIPEIEGFIIHRFPQRSMYFGGVQATLWHPQQGLSAAADPRRTGGVASGGT